MGNWQGEERRTYSPQLTDEQIDAIAERAAERALEKVYTQIGKSIVSKFFLVVGALTLAALAWMNTKGYLGH